MAADPRSKPRATEIGQAKTPIRYNYVTASQMCPQTLGPYKAHF